VWLTKHAARAPMVLRSSNVACQLTAAATGLGVGLFPLPFVRARGLRELRLAPELAASAAQCPTSDLWLVGHRALRDVPRVAAVWKLVADEIRRVVAQDHP
jgi:DNA-binding transcriptional LysR family regulator